MSDLCRAVAARDTQATIAVLAEKHGEGYARDVVDAVRQDVERAKAEHQ